MDGDRTELITAHDLTAHDLATELNLSVETVWKYTRNKKIPCIEPGGRQYRYKLTDVLAALDISTDAEKTGEYQIAPAKKLTYEDYLNIPEEPGYRLEILDGVLAKDPSSNIPHQLASRRLQRILEDYFWEIDPKGEVFDAPLDVTLEETTVVQPDLFYITGEQIGTIDRSSFHAGERKFSL
ncbi:MAG: helix-turn-helix domain-containing protein [Firmicutes bacterium]|nr:helix-turn-helix domain-containing protein [Bacillota bacterium]